MTITRHEPSKILSHAVEANGFVFLAGIVAKDLARDAKGQAAEILGEIDRLLALCGTNKSKIVSATISWTGGANLPVRACIEAKLADPRMLVEIQVTAVK
jgi:enamine deaminase RidA (YjgF/YER057c/UK114 family)